MRVRVWISGPSGPSHDFELIDAPRRGERISISLGGDLEEGTVTAVSWQLQGIERTGDDLAIDGEPMGSVIMVHVVCSPAADVVQLGAAKAEAEAEADAIA